MTAAAMTEDEKRRRRAKNMALGFAVGGLCLLFYLITIVRMGLQ